MEWDVFISHASEDKTRVANPLSALLGRAGLTVWLDANELTLGDSLSRKIDEGLAHSAYGVVILSKHFFAKKWPRHELAGLVAKQIGGREVILPVWHDIDRTYVLEYSPPLADAFAVTTDKGLEHVADQIVRAVRLTPRPLESGAAITSNRIVRSQWIISILLVVAVLTFVLWSYLKRVPKQAVNRRDETRQELVWRQERNSMDGYLVVSCSTCLRPRAWAFHLPATRAGGPREPEDVVRIRTRMSSWPMQEFVYPEDKPGIGSCVDIPLSVCQPPYNEYKWKPSHHLLSFA